MYLTFLLSPPFDRCRVYLTLLLSPPFDRCRVYLTLLLSPPFDRCRVYLTLLLSPPFDRCRVYLTLLLSPPFDRCRVHLGSYFRRHYTSVVCTNSPTFAAIRQVYVHLFSYYCRHSTGVCASSLRHQDASTRLSAVRVCVSACVGTKPGNSIIMRVCSQSNAFQAFIEASVRVSSNSASVTFNPSPAHCRRQPMARPGDGSIRCDLFHRDQTFCTVHAHTS